jgi:hypothetical protein
MRHVHSKCQKPEANRTQMSEFDVFYVTAQVRALIVILERSPVGRRLAGIISAYLYVKAGILDFLQGYKCLHDNNCPANGRTSSVGR